MQARGRRNSLVSLGSRVDGVFRCGGWDVDDSTSPRRRTPDDDDNNINTRLDEAE